MCGLDGWNTSHHCGLKKIEKVVCYKYLPISLPHVEKLVKKRRVKLGFNSKVRKELITATFLSVVNYGDILYMHVAKSILRSLDSVYHSPFASRFVIKAEYSTHHCILYSLSGWPLLSVRRQHH